MARRNQRRYLPCRTGRIRSRDRRTVRPSSTRWLRAALARVRLRVRCGATCDKSAPAARHRRRRVMTAALVWNLIGLGGAAMVIIGTYLAYPPAGFILGGAVLLAVAV